MEPGSRASWALSLPGMLYWRWKQNFVKPGVFPGSFLVFRMMNRQHMPLWEWGLEHVRLPQHGRILDIGCGGGGLLRLMLSLAPDVRFTGVDYSSASVRKTRRLNRKAVREGRLVVEEASVSSLPFDAHTFDLVTSSESLYFWPNPAEELKEVARVLKPGGTLMLCLDVCDPQGKDELLSKLKGFRIYTPVELRLFVEGAGFADVRDWLDDCGRLCLTARCGEGE